MPTDTDILERTRRQKETKLRSRLLKYQNEAGSNTWPEMLEVAMEKTNPNWDYKDPEHQADFAETIGVFPRQVEEYAFKY